MVSYRLSVRRLCLDDLFIFLIFFILFFYLEGMLISIKLQWPALFQTLVFSEEAALIDQWMHLAETEVEAFN
jgi:hypothetical protein